MFFPYLPKILLGIALFSARVCASEMLGVEELKTLQQKMKSASQLSVDFEQTKTNTLRPTKPSRSSGHAVFAKPAKFRWELAKTAGETLIYDGTTLYSLNIKDKVATKYSATADRSLEINEVIGVVLDFDSMLKKYTLSSSIKDGTNVLLTLKPKAESTIDKIEVRVDNATASIKGLKLIFTNKNSSEFQFSNPDRRTPPAKTFDVPKEYKIVEGI